MFEKFEDAQAAVVGWAQSKGILDKSTELQQQLYSINELGEVAAAIRDGEDTDAILTEMGDVIVTCIVAAAIAGRLPSRYFIPTAEYRDDQMRVIKQLARVADNVAEGFYTAAIRDIGAMSATMYGRTALDCLNLAYAKISQRTGKMVDGVFVKDAY